MEKPTNSNWKNFWDGYSYDGILRSIPVRLEEMSRIFSFDEFFEEDSQKEFIAATIVTPEQVVTAFTPSKVDGEVIFHGNVISTILTQINAINYRPKLTIRSYNSPNICSCYPAWHLPNKDLISEEMDILANKYKEVAKLKEDENPLFNNGFDEARINRVVTKEELKLNPDERIIGVPIDEYNRKMEEIHLKMIAKSAKLIFGNSLQISYGRDNRQKRDFDEIQ